MTPSLKSTFVLGHRHLLGIEGLSADDITGLLDLSEEYVELNRQVDKKRASLRGRTQVNLFFEASTRTQSSFEIAGKRLGADVMNMSIGTLCFEPWPRCGSAIVDDAIAAAVAADILLVAASGNDSVAAPRYPASHPDVLAVGATDLTGGLAGYEIDPHARELTPREPLFDTVECLFIGGGFSALLLFFLAVLAGKQLRKIVMRDEDYYDR